MKNKKRFELIMEDNFKIEGNLDIFVIHNEDESDGEVMKWQDIMIHGDPNGLRSFAKLLIKLADLNQDDVSELPVGAREHFHLGPKYELSNSSEQVIIGRLDAKGTGVFYERFIPRDKTVV